MNPMSRRGFLKSSLAAAALAAGPGLAGRSRAADAPFKFDPNQNVIAAPADPALWPEFHRQLAAWREAKRRELNYSDALYRRQDFGWVTSNFCCCFLMLCDETFYDAGKRLPAEEEWQYAAQGPDGRKYPWGGEMGAGRCNSGESGETTPVRMFPEGRSPFEVFDLCGNVWEWTESERADDRTRFAILRGGSFYRRGGSDWYFDEGPRPAWFAAKMLLMWPGLDRCANVGFRCAVSLT